MISNRLFDGAYACTSQRFQCRLDGAFRDTRSLIGIHAERTLIAGGYKRIVVSLPWESICSVSSHDYLLSSFISSLLFFPKITHLPPSWGFAQPHGLECMAFFQLHTQASRTPAGFCAIA